MDDAQIKVRMIEALEPHIKSELDAINLLSFECSSKGFSGRLGLHGVDRHCEFFSVDDYDLYRSIFLEKRQLVDEAFSHVVTSLLENNDYRGLIWIRKEHCITWAT